MPYHRVEHLNHQDVRITELVVHSFEMGVYLVEADYDGRRAFVVDDANKPQRFSSVEQVKQALDRCTIYQAYLGFVDVSGLFLQQSGRFLCQAVQVQCSYST